MVGTSAAAGKLGLAGSALRCAALLHGEAGQYCSRKSFVCIGGYLFGWPSSANSEAG